MNSAVDTKLIIEPNQLLALTDFSIIKMSGSNAMTFLQGQLTCDVTLASQDQLVLGSICNHQGRVLAILYLLKQEHDYYAVIASDLVTEVMGHLQKYAVFSKVELADVSQQYRIYGYIGDVLPDQIAGATQSFPMGGVINRYLIVADRPLIHPAVENKYWQLINIISGIPSIYSATAWKATPHMLNLPHLAGVSFSKGCYVGQEIIARTHYLGKSKKQLCYAEISTTLPILPGDLITADTQEVGFIIDAVHDQELTYLLAVLQDPIDRAFNVHDLLLHNVKAC